MRIGLRDSRYKMPVEKRKFGGKVYKYLMLGNQSDVKRWRGKGYSVRTSRFQGKSAIYIRK
jgi:hypothetical protein